MLLKSRSSRGCAFFLMYLYSMHISQQHYLLHFFSFLNFFYSSRSVVFIYILCGCMHVCIFLCLSRKDFLCEHSEKEMKEKLYFTLIKHCYYLLCLLCFAGYWKSSVSLLIFMMPSIKINMKNNYRTSCQPCEQVSVKMEKVTEIMKKMSFSYPLIPLTFDRVSTKVNECHYCKLEMHREEQD